MSRLSQDSSPSFHFVLISAPTPLSILSFPSIPCLTSLPSIFFQFLLFLHLSILISPPFSFLFSFIFSSFSLYFSHFFFLPPLFCIFTLLFYWRFKVWWNIQIAAKKFTAWPRPLHKKKKIHPIWIVAETENFSALVLIIGLMPPRNGLYILALPKKKTILIIMENHFFSRADANSKESNSLHLFSPTFSISMKWNDYSESIARSAARKVGSLC